MKSCVYSVLAGVGKSDVNASVGRVCRGTLQGGFDHGGRSLDLLQPVNAYVFVDA